MRETLQNHFQNSSLRIFSVFLILVNSLRERDWKAQEGFCYLATSPPTVQEENQHYLDLEVSPNTTPEVRILEQSVGLVWLQLD